MASGLKAATRYGAQSVTQLAAGSTSSLSRTLQANGLRRFAHQTQTTPPTSPFAPRHLLSIADLTPAEFATLVRNAASHKRAIKSGAIRKVSWDP